MTGFHCCLDHECGFAQPPDGRHCSCLRSAVNLSDPKKDCREDEATCTKADCLCHENQATNVLREMLESTPAGRRKLGEARKRRDALFAGYEQGHADALRDAVGAVKKMRDATTRGSVARSVLNQAVAAIEALGGEQ